MKRLLPKSINNPKGFTLVELLVVISIIAILSVIGITVFTGVQKNARDSKRKADIDAIFSAFEASYNSSVGGYINVGNEPTLFVAGITPRDPKTGAGYSINAWDAITGTNMFRAYSACATLEDGTSYCKTNAQ